MARLTSGPIHSTINTHKPWENYSLSKLPFSSRIWSSVQSKRLFQTQKDKFVIRNTTFHDFSQLVSTFTVLWPITGFLRNVLLWVISSCEIPCFNFLLHALAFVMFVRNQLSMSLHWTTATILNCFVTDFHQQSRGTSFWPLWVRIFF